MLIPQGEHEKGTRVALGLAGPEVLVPDTAQEQWHTGTRIYNRQSAISNHPADAGCPACEFEVLALCVAFRYNPPTMALTSRTQRLMLKVFIWSIVCCAAVGIACLLGGAFGWLGGRVMATSGTVSGLALLGLASATVWERKRWQPVGPLGVGAGAVTLVLTLLAIWGDLDWTQEEHLYKGVACAWITTITLTHIALLSLARLKRSYEWVRVVTIIGIVLLAAQIVSTIIAEIDSDAWVRGMGVLAIATACGTIAVPLLHRMSAIRTREAVRTVDLELSLTCPRCELTQQLGVGRRKCKGCGLGINIEIEEEHCATCGYPLYKLESAFCPECGMPISQRPPTE